MTSSNGNIFPVTGPLCGEFTPVTGEFPSQRPVTRSSDVYFDMCLNKRWVNNRGVGDLRHHRTHYVVIVMQISNTLFRHQPQMNIQYVDISFYSFTQLVLSEGYSTFVLQHRNDKFCSIWYCVKLNFDTISHGWHLMMPYWFLVCIHLDNYSNQL